MIGSRMTEAARMLFEARAHRNRLAALPEELRPRTIDEAYAIQDAVIEATGPVGGWKVGARSTTAEPTCAPLCKAWIVQSPATFAANAFARHGIEAELAFTMACDVPAGAGCDDNDIVAAIATLHPAIEVVDSRFAQLEAADPLSQLADFSSHGALVVGPGVPLPSPFDLARQSVSLDADGACLFEAVDSNPAGSPLRLLTWLAHHAARRRGGLRRGDVVTTGSWSGLRFVDERSSVTARFPGEGVARVDFR